MWEVNGQEFSWGALKEVVGGLSFSPKFRDVHQRVLLGPSHSTESPAFGAQDTGHAVIGQRAGLTQGRFVMRVIKVIARTVSPT